MSDNAFLITGANASLSKDAAHQLALRDGVGTIFLACRDKTKAHAAPADVARTTNKAVIEVLIESPW